MTNNTDNRNLIDRDEINLGKLFRIILMQSKLIILITFTFFLIWYSYFIISDRTYEVTSTIQVSNSSLNADRDLNSILTGGGSDTINLEEQIILYETRSNIEELISELNLNIASKEDVSNINILEIENINRNESFKFSITYKDSEYLFNYNNKTEILAYDSISEFNDIKINTSKPNHLKTVDYEYSSVQDLISFYQRLLRINPITTSRSFYSSGGIISVSINSTDPDKAIKIIDKANEIFITKNLLEKSEKATKAISFIDQQLSTIEQVLLFDKDNLNKFQETNTTINYDLETQAILSNLSELQKKLTSLELEEAKIGNSYTNENPLFKNLQFQKKVLTDQSKEIERRIKKLPSSQQEYIDLYRKVEISQELQRELLNRKLSYSIMEASTLGNVRVINAAYNKSLVSPKIIFGLVFAFLGFVLGTLISIYRGLFLMPISNPAEIYDSGISTELIGVFPNLNIDADEENSTLFEQSLESLLLNLDINDSNKQTILFTSPTESNGKTFLTRHIAEKISKLDIKCLLIDLDLKRGDLHRFFDKKTISKEKFNNIFDSGFEEFKVNSSYYFIPRIKRLHSSFQWLNSGIMSRFIEKAREEFDVIIIDTAPFLSVSDTSLLTSFVDKCLLVSMHDVTTAHQISQCIENFDQLGKQFDGIIYNNYKKPKGYFGYYQYYGNYNYQYYAEKYLYTSYEYENE